MGSGADDVVGVADVVAEPTVVVVPATGVTPVPDFVVDDGFVVVDECDVVADPGTVVGIATVGNSVFDDLPVLWDEEQAAVSKASDITSAAPRTRCSLIRVNLRDLRRVLERLGCRGPSPR